MPEKESVTWPHAPPHYTQQAGIYMVTAGTYQKQHFFKGPDRLKILHNALLRLSEQYTWQLQAWAVFSNHYHFIASSPSQGASNLNSLIRHLHSETARLVNQLDNQQGRKLWHNFRETHLTFEKSYYARLHYVLNNPVKHGLVQVADQYPWCSAAWFTRKASTAFQKTVKSFPCDRVKVDDDYEVYGSKH
ncbi:MAG: REP-associated tyrosine transposase [Akkermansiaceae bacterium]